MNYLGLKKSIGKMGSLAKTGASRVGQAVKEEYQQAKEEYPEVRRRAGKAYNKAGKIANRGLDYAERVRNNASESKLFGDTTSHSRHEKSERSFFGSDYEEAEHRKPSRSGQTIVIHVNGKGNRRKKKRQHTNRRSGFSLI